MKIICGSVPHQLEKYIDEHVDGHALWESRFLVPKYHNKLVKVYRDFIRAGADIVTTATYQATMEDFIKYLGVSTEEAVNLFKNSVEVAREAWIEEKKLNGDLKPVEVAGSVGSYGASLHDGSEYTGKHCSSVTMEQLMSWQEPRIRALIEGGVDMLAFETIPCSVEAMALLKVLKKYPSMKAWLSFTISDSETLCNGENLSDVAIKCWNETDQLMAIGANCFHPSLATDLVKKLNSDHPQIKCIVYTNSGEEYDTKSKSWKDSELGKFEDFIPDWLNLKVSYIGGCCRTFDSHIYQLHQEIKKHNLK